MSGLWQFLYPHYHIELLSIRSGKLGRLFQGIKQPARSDPDGGRRWRGGMVPRSIVVGFTNPDGQFIEDLPINMVMFNSYVQLPEGVVSSNCYSKSSMVLEFLTPCIQTPSMTQLCR